MNDVSLHIRDKTGNLSEYLQSFLYTILLYKYGSIFVIFHRFLVHSTLLRNVSNRAKTTLMSS